MKTKPYESCILLDIAFSSYAKAITLQLFFADDIGVASLHIKILFGPFTVLAYPTFGVRI